MPPRKRRKAQVYRDQNGTHVHNQTTDRGHGAAFPNIVEERVLYRALCACGQVFEGGDRLRVKVRLIEHIANSMAKMAVGIEPKKRE